MVKNTGSKWSKRQATRQRKQAAFKAANRKLRRQGKPARLMAEWRAKGADQIVVTPVAVGYYD